MKKNKTNWLPNSWRAKKALHQPIYEDEKKLSEVTKKMSKFPPLVFAGEVRQLKNQLAKCVNGEGFYFKLVTVQKVLLNSIRITSEIHLEL